MEDMEVPIYSYHEQQPESKDTILQLDGREIITILTALRFLVSRKRPQWIEDSLSGNWIFPPLTNKEIEALDWKIVMAGPSDSYHRIPHASYMLRKKLLSEGHWQELVALMNADPD